MSRVNDQVVVYASAARKDLRTAQRDLNSMLWASELTYNLVLCGRLSRREPLESAMKHLGHLQASAWKRGRNERAHCEGRTLRDFLTDVERAQNQISKTVLVAWLAHFDDYLAQSVERPEEFRGRPWGPYAGTLGSISHLVSGPWAVQLRTVLYVDMWRTVRNMLVHEPSISSGKLRTTEGCNELARKVQPSAKNDWSGRWGISRDGAVAIVADVADASVHRARHMAKRAGGAPVELLCCLYAFTAVDELAHEIEDANFDGVATGKTILIRRAVVRRRDDMIVR
jgi:hypothetical protein